MTNGHIEYIWDIYHFMHKKHKILNRTSNTHCSCPVNTPPNKQTFAEKKNDSMSNKRRTDHFKRQHCLHCYIHVDWSSNLWWQTPREWLMNGHEQFHWIYFYFDFIDRNEKVIYVWDYCVRLEIDRNWSKLMKMKKLWNKKYCNIPF